MRFRRSTPPAAVSVDRHISSVSQLLFFLLFFSPTLRYPVSAAFLAFLDRAAIVFHIRRTPTISNLCIKRSDRIVPDTLRHQNSQSRQRPTPPQPCASDIYLHPQKDSQRYPSPALQNPSAGPT
ncbi:hypothetical protein CC80DRAFT_181859 [Byssothecium circinans]|uniref:Uncharacterized protein n=1 Tax=Byssothecium circinans TaxID=147558 RepID=A0A6A5THV1_9PLEO|nr:hypothetical protein CC80DRAFT_181859 [Byssothecium circinans]